MTNIESVFTFINVYCSTHEVVNYFMCMRAVAENFNLSLEDAYCFVSAYRERKTAD